MIMSYDLHNRPERRTGSKIFQAKNPCWLYSEMHYCRNCPFRKNIGNVCRRKWRYKGSSKEKEDCWITGFSILLVLSVQSVETEVLIGDGMLLWWSMIRKLGYNWILSLTSVWSQEKHVEPWGFPGQKPTVHIARNNSGTPWNRRVNLTVKFVIVFSKLQQNAS